MSNDAAEEEVEKEGDWGGEWVWKVMQYIHMRWRVYN